MAVQCLSSEVFKPVDKIDLRDAVKQWLENTTTAESKYGHISNWDTSAVTDMSRLFRGGVEFDAQNRLK
eukprot:3592878-Amphidinium_carterae.1